MSGNCGACSRMLAVMLALLGCLIMDDMLQLGVLTRNVSINFERHSKSERIENIYICTKLSPPYGT